MLCMTSVILRCEYLGQFSSLNLDSDIAIPDILPELNRLVKILHVL